MLRLVFDDYAAISLKKKLIRVALLRKIMRFHTDARTVKPQNSGIFWYERHLVDVRLDIFAQERFECVSLVFRRGGRWAELAVTWKITKRWPLSAGIVRRR